MSAVLELAGCSWDEVTLVGTSRRLADDERLICLGPPVAGFDLQDLHSVAVPTKPTPVAARLWAPPVAEAAALLAAGPGSRIVVPRFTGRYVTVAAAVGAGR